MPKRSRPKDESKCIGFSEALELKRAERDRRSKPQPWFARKFTVGLVLAIVGYTYYVYIARFCVPMILRREGGMGGRTMGIVFLVVFCLLGFMFFWTYAKVLQHALEGMRDKYVHVPKTPAPGPSHNRHPRPPSDSEIGTPYEATSQAETSNDAHSDSVTNRDPEPHSVLSEKHSPGPSSSSPDSRRHPKRTISTPRTRPEDNAGVLDAMRPSAEPPADTHSSPKRQPGPSAKPEQSSGDADGLPPPMFSRRPPTHPVLAPEYRYCMKDECVKPMRTHHCRSCGKCVLNYDHHCPWIGQCVGAFNRKFFVNFLQWCIVFTSWVFSTLVALNGRASQNNMTDIDPQEIVVIALSGFFTLFVSVLLASHVHLIMRNQTTVESTGVHRMKERERELLSKMTGFAQFRKRAAIKRQWDQEWGKLGTEGNLWWLGSNRANWEATMGSSVWGWFLPIGRGQGDGLTYPTNPRFDADGRWRRRSQWPAELQ